MESNCDNTSKFCIGGNEEISVYSDLKNIFIQLALPEQQFGFDQPLQADSFQDFILKSQLNLEKALSLLSGIDKSVNLPKNVVIYAILLIGEQSKSEVWTNNKNLNYAKQLLNELLIRCKCSGLIHLLLLFKVDSFLLELRPKLLKNTWKNYPAAVSCFMWMLLNIKCPYLGDVLNSVLPTCLFLVDDHEYRNKVLGLQCLEHIASNVSRTELSQYGRGTVMYNAVEHMIYLREPDIIPPLATCLTALLSKTEHSSITSTLSWSHFDDVLNIWLPAMEMEQKLVVREAYINSLNSLLQAMGLASVRWSNKLLEIFSEYCEQDHTCDKSLMIRSHQRVPSGSQEFIEVTKRDAENRLQIELERLLGKCSEFERTKFKHDFDGFKRLFDRFLIETGPSINWNKIEKLPTESVCDYGTLTTPSADVIHQMLSKLIVIKLNGGLGTSMGCHGPKSVIPVRSDFTFLDLTVQQIEHLNKTYKANVPLVLMNSFNTDEDTQKIIRKYQGLQVEIYTFQQSAYPRINKDTLLPITKDLKINDDIEAWYPPGHGDFYESMRNSGLLKKFIDQGREYCFISNIDNLGATVDVNILNLLLNSPSDNRPEFLMEITDKTKADVKGGTLIQYESKLRLLEIAQVPKDNVDDFKSIKTFKFFNTNNLWIKLDAIERVLSEGSLVMEVIVNPKLLDNNVPVIQLETAVGAAMKCFERGLGINVPRSRFLPVKKTSDLMLVMSNLYSFNHGSLVMSPQRMFPTTPLVKLGDNHFAKVKDFLMRFATIPDMLELDHLTVSGDVTFGKNVSLKGTVIIIANHGDRIDIPAGANLENKIVSGNLRILDH